jgi:predicted dehydrogenase
MSVAVIGAGNWGKNLVSNLQSLRSLSAVAEASPVLREALARRYPGVPLYEDYRPVLASSIPAIAIATPAPTHHAIARDALLAGKDVFVEKPLVLSTRHAQELVELAASRRRVLMVGHLLLYQPAIRWLKEYLQTGALGKLHSLHQKRLNLGRARSVENALWSLGVHDIAVLLYLVGREPASLRIVGQHALQPGVEDDVYLHLDFPGGVQAHLHTSWLWPEKSRSLTVIGSRGMLIFDETQQTVTLHRKRIRPDLNHHDEGTEVVFQGHGEPLRLELEHFLSCLSARRQPLSDGASGLAVIRVLEQASAQLRMADDGWRIEPPDPVHASPAILPQSTIRNPQSAIEGEAA